MDEFEPLEKVELATLRAEHQKRFQPMIQYVKEKVGKGIEYRNAVVRIVVSDQGAYYELIDLPEEFSGAAGEEIERRFVAPQEAISLLERAVEATQHVTPDNTRQLSIFVLYTRRGLVDRKNCYVYDYQPDENTPAPAPRIIGQFQPGVMPLFYKIRMDSDLATDALEMPHGLIFCMANAGDRHLLIRIPFQGDQVTDLSAPPNSKTVQ